MTRLEKNIPINTSVRATRNSSLGRAFALLNRNFPLRTLVFDLL